MRPDLRHRNGNGGPEDLLGKRRRPTEDDVCDILLDANISRMTFSQTA